jgi:hypothetical protein
MVQVKWTKLAVEDLKGIYEYISRDSIKYAKIQVIRLKSRTNRVKDTSDNSGYIKSIANFLFRYYFQVYIKQENVMLFDKLFLTLPMNIARKK